MIEVYKELKAVMPKRKQAKTYRHIYRVGDVLANGVMYFGQEKVVKKSRTALFICPRCNESWRVSISHIAQGRIKSCGCRQ